MIQHHMEVRHRGQLQPEVDVYVSVVAYDHISAHGIHLT